MTKTALTGTERRTARKSWRCGSCEGWINPGDDYLVHTDFPGSGIGYGDEAGHPVRFAECSDCACRYGRRELLYPVLEGQSTIEDAL